VPDWVIEPLSTLHERANFTCGHGSLDAFLRHLVTQYERRRLGRTYVVVFPGEKRVAGYYTLASGSITFESLPEHASRRLPRHPVPVILLARLAVDKAARGRGLGRLLLMDALDRCCTLAARLGVYAVEVDTIDEHAQSFYRKYGFIPLLDRPMHLYLPVRTIEEALGRTGGNR
jgi:GNAT superfamily N-acetyltransferase